MKEYVCESGMKFGPFPSDTLIRLEEIPQYKRIQQGMHMAEFMYYEEERRRLISVEAKTTAPNPDSEAVEHPKERFREYISDIREKFENSLDLYINMALKGEVSDYFKKIDYRNLEIIFILVIKEQRKEWLGNVKDAMEMAVRSVIRTNKIWRCKVLVINEEIAKKRKLIV